MVGELKITKHAIEEFMKDNPKVLTPEKHIRKKFIHMLGKIKTMEARYWTKGDGVRVIRWDDVAIVHADNVIITYWRIISKEAKNCKRHFSKKILSML